VAQRKEINLNQKVQKDFLTYANAVIKSRAISSVEDNLKPVHRRILYTMAENKLWSNKKTVKSANVVGLTMMRHPHGDSSIYDAMVRLSQPWKMRYPLIEMQGNSGNILGDGPAAMRYTEARLSSLGEMMLKDINKDSVKFKLSYDESATEPVVLPSAFPNILCNGNSGIAVGLSASLVPHNLNEIVDGIIAYLNFKGITVEQLMKHIPAPDFPTGGTIVDSGKLKEIYEIGNGTFTLRSKYKIENVGAVQHIVITEVPFLVSVEEGIIEPLKKLVLEEGFDLIEDYENNTDKNGVNLRIILKKGANIYKVLETLWQNTRLQITQRVSNTVIHEGNPHTFNLKQLIEHYVLHRHEVISNVAKYDLAKTNERLEVVNALLTALDKIDEVIALIKKAKNKGDAREQLISFLKISEFQANAILDMKLSRINQLDKIELTDEFKQLQEKQKELSNILNDEPTRENIMRKELLEMAKLHGDKRRTTLAYASADAAEGMPIEPINILFFESGATFATQQKFEDLDFKRKTSELNHSAIRLVLETKTDKNLSVFTKDGTMWSHKVLTMTSESLEMGTFSSAPLAAFDFADKTSLKDYIIFVTSGGLVKKTKTSEYINGKNGSRTIKLKGDQELIFVGMANDTDNIMILDEKLVFFKVKDITQSTKITVGSKGIASGKAISAAIVSDKDKVLTLNAEGQGKLTKASDFVITAKASNGQVVSEKTTIVKRQQESYFIFDGSKNIFIDKNPATKGKTAIGSKLINGNPVHIA
jgi:DNA gyrase subunit A